MAQSSAIIFFGFPARDRTVADSVAQLGLNLLKASPCDLQITCATDFPQPGYASYLRNLPAHLLATVTKKKQSYRTEGFPLISLRDILPFQSPSIAFSLTRPKNEVLATVDGMATYKIAGKVPVYVCERPDAKCLTDLGKLGVDMTTRPPLNCLNMSAYRFYLISLRLITLLIQVHTYPAARDVDHLNQLIAEFDVGSSDDAGERGTKRPRIEESSTSSSSSAPAAPPEKSDKSASVDPCAREITIYSAKPAKMKILNDVVTLGPPEDMDGIWFPFVNQLAKFDTKTVPDFITKYLMKSLAPNFYGQVTTAEAIRGAWGVIGKVDAGMELTHAVKVLSCALECQATAHPVFEGGVYAGTMMLGAGYTVAIRDKVYRPVPNSQWKTMVTSTSPILSILTEISDLSGIDVKECKTMSELAVELKVDTVDYPPDVKSKILSLAKRLRFSENPEPVHAETLVNMLKTLVQEEGEINVGTYLHWEALFKDHRRRTLSAFGSRCPSFNVRGGKTVTLKPGSTVITTLSVQMKPLEEAHADFVNLFATNQITNDLNSLKGKHVYRSFSGAAKSSVWNTLISIAHPDGAEPTHDAQEAVANPMADFAWG